MTDDETLAELLEVLALLRGPGDELRVMTAIARRLVVGLERYGRLDLRRDRRNWLREASEEWMDGIVYTACDAVTRAWEGEGDGS